MAADSSVLRTGVTHASPRLPPQGSTQARGSARGEGAGEMQEGTREMRRGGAQKGTICRLATVDAAHEDHSSQPPSRPCRLPVMTGVPAGLMFSALLASARFSTRVSAID